jgi:hypothetical protein
MKIKVKQFVAEDWFSVPKTIEFWEADDSSLPPDHHFKWVRTTLDKNSPEIYKWEWFLSPPPGRSKDLDELEFVLEQARDKALN